MLDQLAFPEGFLWGTACSAYQVEGDNRRNQWWQFEQQPGAIWHNERSGRACDWWQNAEQDFDRMKQLHLNVQRISIEWSRVEPQRGVFDPVALDRYHAMLAGLHARGIRPMVALHHFTNPLWFEHAGGWESPDSVSHFARYAQTIVTTLGDLCDFWLTMNEPIVHLVQGWMRGIWPPHKRSYPATRQVFLHLLQAHAAAYHVLHKHQPTAQVSYAHVFKVFYGQRQRSMLDRIAAMIKRHVVEQLWLRATIDGKVRAPLGNGRYDPSLANTLDFIGVNYYSSTAVRFTPNPLPLFGYESIGVGSELSDSGRNGPYSAYQPRALYHLCLELSTIPKPIYITENGLPDADDDQRPRWLLAHLFQIYRAIRAGCDIRGYFHWTLVDNFEWTDGWGLRFGLFALDPQTQVRTPRPSAHLYGEIARHNALSRALVTQYTPNKVRDYFGD
jgi:beta-glucosidase